ncbi:HutD family protein [Pseudomonas sp. R2.Fl]|nr:HutD family protein [Pseudomonas sp. R2.Fl]
MRILRAGEHTVMPWKNGLGVTREVALEPAAMPDAPFLWRLSVATIKTSSPFSTFRGIDRTIAALSGEPVRLLVDGKDTVTLEALGKPFSFAGESAVDAASAGGETTDLNIMTLRGHAAHEMTRLSWTGSLSVPGARDLNMVVFTGPAVIVMEEARHDVAAHDVATDIRRGQVVTLDAKSPAVAYLIGIDITR